MRPCQVADRLNISAAFELPFPAAGCTLTVMRKRILSVALGISSLAAALLAAEVPVSAPSGGASASGHDDYPFFPFCIDWHDAKKRTFEQQAEMLKELGYPGVGRMTNQVGAPYTAETSGRRRPDSLSPR